jgi:hemerythrin-like domain-containing protein
MVGVEIGGQRPAGFDQPLELLKDCHRRIEHFLDVLQQVVERFGDGPLPDEGRRALEASLDYFARMAPRHTADEEQSLFPRLRASGAAEARAVMAELDRLEAEHRRADACHAKVDELGRAWLQAERIDVPDRTALRALIDEMIALYAVHIRLEDERVFEVAAQTLKASDLSEVGLEMRRRRTDI